MSLLSLILFLYVMANDVVERFGETYVMFSDLQKQKQAVLAPEQMVERKASLLQRKTKLVTILSGNVDAYEQSQTGIFEFLTASAQRTGVLLESLVPVLSESRGTREVGFTVRARSEFHKVARFVNTVENGPFGISLRKLDITSDNQRRPYVSASIDGIAYIMSK